MQSEGDEGGICVVAESCHQTSEGIGLMASRMLCILREWFLYQPIHYYYMGFLERIAGCADKLDYGKKTH